MPKIVGTRLHAVLVMLGLAVACLTGVAPASAHPHVWVSVDTTVLVEKGAIVGFRHKWTFDEFYTAMAIEGLDTNKDGVYSRAELAELAKVNIDGLKDFKFFTFAKLGDKELEFDAPKDFWLDHGLPPGGARPGPTLNDPAQAAAAKPAEKSGVMNRVWSAISGSPKKEEPEPAKVLTLEFTLPLKQPVLIDAPEFSFAIYDPSWFIAFDVPNANAVKLADGAPGGCHIIAKDTSASAPGSDTQKLQDTFATQLGGGAAAVTLTEATRFQINCGRRS